MGTTTQLRRTAIALAALAGCWAAAAGPADAKRYSVSGKQTVVDEQAGLYRMEGDLVGDWTITSFKELATEPLVQAKGTERFRGCIDRGHDGDCTGDPTGKLRLRFRYWALFGSDGALHAGACWHPIVGGTGAFAHARGVIQMLDVPTSTGVETTYAGQIRTGGHAAAVSSRRRCG
jgi:hypothetical protein